MNADVHGSSRKASVDICVHLWLHTATEAAAGLTSAAARLASRPRQRPVERVRERLLLARAVGRVAAGLDPRAAQPIHVVPHREPLADALGRVLLAARVDDDD